MNYEIDEFKVWVFYLKTNPDEIYAYTTVKEYKDHFLEVRDKNKFIIEKLTLDEFEFSLFTNSNKQTMLVQCPFGYGTKEKEYVHIVLSYAEEMQLNQFAWKIEHTMEDLYRSIVLKSSIKKKYKEAAEYLLDTSYDIVFPTGGAQNTSRFNMLSGFSMLFKETLKEGS